MSGTQRQDGLTLLEVVIAAAVLAVLAGAAYAVLSSGIDTYGTGVSASELDKHGNLVVDRIAGAIARSGSTMLSPALAPPNASDRITYQVSVGYTGGAVQWGPVCRVLLESPENDPDDGKDNDGDGIVDERQVVLVEDLGGLDERRTVLTTDVPELLQGEEDNGKDDNGNGLVDEPGLSIDCDGTMWTVRLSLVRPAGKGRFLTRTVETSVCPRNGP